MRERNDRSRFVKVTLTAVAALVLSTGVLPAEEPFEWTGTVPLGAALEIKNVNGDIDAQPAAGSEIEVLATKWGHGDDPAGVHIEVVEHEGGVTVCAIYPGPYRCAPGDGGRVGADDYDVEVRFRVRVPVGVALVAHTTNGEISTGSLDGNVEAYTVNGSIEFRTTGFGQASTVNGSISATIGRADWDGRMRFKTVNGDVTLTAPAALSADVHLETLNGSLETDFPMTVTGRLHKNRLRGTLGSGGRELELESLNGSVRLKGN